MPEQGSKIETPEKWTAIVGGRVKELLELIKGDFFEVGNHYGLEQFLSDDEVKQAQSENEIIYKVVAPNFLAETVINYSLKHPQDPRAPEALNSVVDATHYAQCADEKTTDYSKQAFQLLHNNYPGSYWAKETPYWY